jgi:ribonuclease P protein component
MPDPAGAPDRGLARHQRLTRSVWFQEAFAQREKWVGRFLVLYIRRGEGASLRLGVISSRKVSRRAHDRNRARRLLREAWRIHRHRLSGSADVVLVARGHIVQASFSEVEEELLRLAGRAKLLPENA